MVVGLGDQKWMVVSSSIAMVWEERLAAERVRRIIPPNKVTRLIAMKMFETCELSKVELCSSSYKC